MMTSVPDRCQSQDDVSVHSTELNLSKTSHKLKAAESLHLTSEETATSCKKAVATPDTSATNRRDFLKTASAGALTASTMLANPPQVLPQSTNTAAFPTTDSLVVPHQWESLNPGYWQIQNGALRRRLTNVGDRARRTGFPFHSANLAKEMETDYDPSLPYGIIYRRDWKLAGRYIVEAEFTIHVEDLTPKEGDNPGWKMYDDSYSSFGIALGSKCVFESHGKMKNVVHVVHQNGLLEITAQYGRNRRGVASGVGLGTLKPGTKVTMQIFVTPRADNRSTLDVHVTANGITRKLAPHVPTPMLNGFAGVIGRGLRDFEVNQFKVTPFENKPLTVPKLDCFACYPLGETLKQVDGQWTCRFVALFASDGNEVELRISQEENPHRGWNAQPTAGRAKIVNHEWRRNTAVIDVVLPRNPAETAMYYTVWKDGVNVTTDTRIGTDACGPGTGFVGDVPSSGSYVGRLPQLTAPYKLCGLSCHAITSGLQTRTADGWKMLGGNTDWQLRDQPTQEAYKHLEDYNFQVMVWEDDVWYMELVLYPPSTDDAYRVITNSICGPTSRWQMMRHWNVLNPGDHDYGMDDVKGPEQLAIRRVEGLGQDASYMRRNFQIVHHLVTGAEEVDPLANPKKWRAWKMPNRDFTFVILDSRLWRSSQDTDIWDDAGWGAFKNLYDRTDPTRSLLGEEQFAWLQNLIRTDSSPLICLTGINGMHTVWDGAKYKGGAADHIKGPFDQRDRVTADYAGWVKAGSDRVLELLGSRDGIVTVYGDVHNGCIMKNKQHNVYECSFGPIGRSGGRAVIPGFGPNMKDFDGRELEITSLYHKSYSDAELNGHATGEPFYWNFLEMEFDPWKEDSQIQLRIRNLVDSPEAQPRGGGSIAAKISETGRPVQSKLPTIKTLPNSDVRFMSITGRPLRSTRSDADGNVLMPGFTDAVMESKVIMLSFDGATSESKVVTTS